MINQDKTEMQRVKNITAVSFFPNEVEEEEGPQINASFRA